jgi:hypothetical protein
MFLWFAEVLSPQKIIGCANSKSANRKNIWSENRKTANHPISGKLANPEKNLFRKLGVCDWPNLFADRPTFVTLFWHKTFLTFCSLQLFSFF